MASIFKYCKTRKYSVKLPQSTKINSAQMIFHMYQFFFKLQLNNFCPFLIPEVGAYVILNGRFCLFTGKQWRISSKFCWDTV